MQKNQFYNGKYLYISLQLNLIFYSVQASKVTYYIQITRLLSYTSKYEVIILTDLTFC